MEKWVKELLEAQREKAEKDKISSGEFEAKISDIIAKAEEPVGKNRFKIYWR